MEVPDEDEDMQGNADANIVFVLEKATLETAKVGKVSCGAAFIAHVSVRRRLP